LAGTIARTLTYLRGKVLRFDSPKVFQYTFTMGQNDKASRATIELVPESKATKVTVAHDSGPKMTPLTLPAPMDGHVFFPA